MRLAWVLIAALMGNAIGRHFLLRWWNDRSDLRSSRRFDTERSHLDRARRPR